MTTTPATDAWAENFDLRKLIANLARNWKIALVAAAISTSSAVVFSVLLQPTVYQSSSEVLIAEETIEGEFGLTQPEYLELVHSLETMESVREQLGINTPLPQLQQQFSFRLENNLLNVSTTAESPEAAYLLAETWIQSYQQTVGPQLTSKFTDATQAADQEIERVAPDLAAAEEEIDRFSLDLARLENRYSHLANQMSDRENLLDELRILPDLASEKPLGLFQARLDRSATAVGGGGTPGSDNKTEDPLARLVLTDDIRLNPGTFYLLMDRNLRMSRLLGLEQDLVASEHELRELQLSAIPATETRISSLEKALSVEPPFLEQKSNSAETEDSSTLNQVYQELSKDLAMSRILLDVQKHEVDSLLEKIESLRLQWEELREELLHSFDMSQEVETLEAETAALRSQIREVEETLLAERAVQRKLENEARPLRTRYDRAVAERDRLAAMERDVAALTDLTIVSDPNLPTSPQSPQRGRNLILSAFLGLVVGAIASLTVDHFRGRRAPEPNFSG